MKLPEAFVKTSLMKHHDIYNLNIYNLNIYITTQYV